MNREEIKEALFQEMKYKVSVVVKDFEALQKAVNEVLLKAYGSAGPDPEYWGPDMGKAGFRMVRKHDSKTLFIIASISKMDDVEQHVNDALKVYLKSVEDVPLIYRSFSSEYSLPVEEYRLK